jgi:uncharacterized protein YecE (DUF72 family)
MSGGKVPRPASGDIAPQPLPAPPSSPLGRLLVGCAGWSYPHWRHKFYPPNVRAENELQFYQQRFNACEINFTYHQMPTVERCEKWRMSSPPGFLLSLKAPKTLTHMSPLSIENHPQWVHFLSAAKGLGDRLGPVLVQLPPSFALDLPRLRALQPLLPKDGSIRAAFEFRHNSWFCEDVYNVMRNCNWALVKHAVPSAGVSERWDVATSDWVYLRLHGKKDEHVWDYSSDELQPYVARITELRARGQDCFVYFLNDADARAPANATAFFRAGRQAAGEKWEGLLGAGVDGAGVLKGMFGKQQQQQQQHQQQQQQHGDLSPILQQTGSSLPHKAPSSPSHSPTAPSPSATDTSSKPTPRASGIMRFFQPQTPPSLLPTSLAPSAATPPPAKKMRRSAGAPVPEPASSAAASAALRHDQAVSCRLPSAMPASGRDEAEVIVLD